MDRPVNETMEYGRAFAGLLALGGIFGLRGRSGVRLARARDRERPPATGTGTRFLHECVVAFTVMWEFRVAPEHAADFEALYAPDGAWARLFMRAAGYLGSELLVDAEESNRYLTVDRWHSRAALDAFRERWRAEYDALDRRCDALGAREVRVGAFVPA